MVNARRTSIDRKFEHGPCPTARADDSASGVAANRQCCKRPPHGDQTGSRSPDDDVSNAPHAGFFAGNSLTLEKTRDRAAPTSTILPACERIVDHGLCLLSSLSRRRCGPAVVSRTQASVALVTAGRAEGRRVVVGRRDRADRAGLRQVAAGPRARADPAASPARAQAARPLRTQDRPRGPPAVLEARTLP